MRYPPIGTSGGSFARDQCCAQNWRFGLADQQPWSARRRTAAGGACQPGSAKDTRYPEASWSRAPAMLGRPSAPEIVQVTNFVGPMCGLSEVISWTCGGVRMNCRSAALSFQTEQGPVVAGQWSGPQRVADQAVCGGQLLAHRQDSPEEAHRGGDPLERQMGGHDQVAGSGFHLRAGCPGQVRHGSEPISGTNRPTRRPGSASPGNQPDSVLRHGPMMSRETNLPDGPANAIMAHRT